MIKTGVSEQKITNTQKKAHNKHFYRIIVDRRKAINWIIKKLAKKNDIILFCGKGHEQSFCIGKTEYPWDEKNEILNALKK
jgi:UDP-N-acetylmuramoyl-L-alanyl-D-glutamate--2,6-diaminopimelate ligase